MVIMAKKKCMYCRHYRQIIKWDGKVNIEFCKLTEEKIEHDYSCKL